MKRIIYKIISKIFFWIERVAFSYRYDYVYREKYNIDNTFRFNGKNILMYGNGQINIGANSYIGSHSSILAYEGCQVNIGKNCSISHYFTVYTMNRNSQDIVHGNQENRMVTGNVSIGDNCWIGHNVFIREGVSIGPNCVIGGHSVVTKDIPSNSIAVGSPARVV